MEPWTTKEFARKVWVEAENIDDDVLDVLLEVGTEACSAYAPALPTGVTTRPKRHEVAVVYQARDTWTARERSGDSDLVGVGDYAIRARPLTDQVRQLLRPRRAVPRFGGLT